MSGKMLIFVRGFSLISVLAGIRLSGFPLFRAGQRGSFDVWPGGLLTYGGGSFDMQILIPY